MGSQSDYSLTVVPVEDDHPDDLSGPGIEIDDEIVLTGDFEVEGDVDVFRLDVKAGDGFQITGDDYGLRFLNQDGDVVAACFSRCKSWSWKAVYDGPIFLQVVGQDPGSTVLTYNYVLTSVVNADDYQDNVDTNATLLEYDARVPGVHEFSNDSDVFAIDAQEADIIEFTTEIGQRPEYQVYSIDDDGNLLEHGRGSGPTFRWRVPLSGRFYVSHQGNAGPYSLTASVVGVDDYPDSTLDAPSLAFPQVGRMETLADVDYFSLNLQQGDAILLQLAPQSQRSPAQEFDLLHASGDTVVAGGARGEISGRVTETGTYFVRLRTGGLEEYTLSTRINRDVDAESIQNATPISVGLTVNSNIDYRNDVDTFRFAASQNRPYRINVERDSFASNSTIKVFDADGDEVASKFGAQLDWTATSAGQYFVQVTGSVPVGYWLTVGEIESDDEGNQVVGE